MTKYEEALRSNKVVFEVEFDREVWATMNGEQKNLWIDDLTNSISDHARVSAVFLSEVAPTITTSKFALVG